MGKMGSKNSRCEKGHVWYFGHLVNGKPDPATLCECGQVTWAEESKRIDGIIKKIKRGRSVR